MEQSMRHDAIYRVDAFGDLLIRALFPFEFHRPICWSALLVYPDAEGKVHTESDVKDIVPLG